MKTIVSMFALFVALCCMAQGKVVNAGRERLIKFNEPGNEAICEGNGQNPFAEIEKAVLGRLGRDIVVDSDCRGSDVIQ